MNEANSDDSDVYMYQTCGTTHYWDQALRDNVKRMFCARYSLRPDILTVYLFLVPTQLELHEDWGRVSFSQSLCNKLLN